MFSGKHLKGKMFSGKHSEISIADAERPKSVQLHLVGEGCEEPEGVTLSVRSTENN